MQRVVLLLLFMVSASSVYAQATVNYTAQNRVDTVTSFTSKPYKPYMFVCNPNKYSPKIVSVIPQNLYTQHFSFFCRQELKMQQAHIPLAFRLGSMDYCDMLEQKRSGINK